MAGTMKLKQWKPQPKPNEEMCKCIRQLVVEAIMGYWTTEHKPSTLMRVFCRVQDRIKELKAMGNWPWKIPGKRTVDRRVNEAADPRFYEDGAPKIVAVTAGEYQPNPQLFSEGKTGLHSINTSSRVKLVPIASKLVEVGVCLDSSWS